MIKILFVCLGNICRSPMAEAIMNDLIKKEGLEDEIQVDSAGTEAWHIGKAPHEGTREILTENFISYEGLQARQVNKNDLQNFEYIIAMDVTNLGNLRKMAGFEQPGYIGRLMDFVPDADVMDVSDPYYTGNFKEVYTMIKSGCEHLLEDIKKQYHLGE